MTDFTLINGIAKAVMNLRAKGGNAYLFPKDAENPKLDVTGLEGAIDLGLVVKDAHRTRTLYMLSKLGWALDTPEAAEHEVHRLMLRKEMEARNESL